MTREEATTILMEHLDHWKRLLSEGICTKDEGKRTIDALTFAIESIKALEQEPILDKVRAEIDEYGSIWVQYTITDNSVSGIEKIVADVLAQAKEHVIEIIDKYKAESEQETAPFDFELYQAGLMDMPKEIIEVLDKIRAELHATAEMHEDSDYYLREEWVDEIIDKYTAESEK